MADIDKAIRTWGQKTEDVYERGMVALYEKNYPEASRQLAESLRLREANLQKAQADTANAAFFSLEGLCMSKGDTKKAAGRMSERWNFGRTIQ